MVFESEHLADRHGRRLDFRLRRRTWIGRRGHRGRWDQLWLRGRSRTPGSFWFPLDFAWLGVGFFWPRIGFLQLEVGFLLNFVRLDFGWIRFRIDPVWLDWSWIDLGRRRFRHWLPLVHEGNFVVRRDRLWPIFRTRHSPDDDSGKDHCDTAA